jgi:hypothetical protein
VQLQKENYENAHLMDQKLQEIIKNKYDTRVGAVIRNISNIG